MNPESFTNRMGLFCTRANRVDEKDLLLKISGLYIEEHLVRIVIQSFVLRSYQQTQICQDGRCDSLTGIPP